MNQGQKTVLVLLTAVLLLEFGSLTKLKTLWGLAFNATYPNAGTAKCPQGATFDLPASGQCPPGYQIQTNFDGRKYCICTAGLHGGNTN